MEVHQLYSTGNWLYIRFSRAFCTNPYSLLALPHLYYLAQVKSCACLCSPSTALHCTLAFNFAHCVSFHCTDFALLRINCIPDRFITERYIPTEIWNYWFTPISSKHRLMSFVSFFHKQTCLGEMGKTKLTEMENDQRDIDRLQTCPCGPWCWPLNNQFLWSTFIIKMSVQKRDKRFNPKKIHQNSFLGSHMSFVLFFGSSICPGSWQLLLRRDQACARLGEQSWLHPVNKRQQRWMKGRKKSKTTTRTTAATINNNQQQSTTINNQPLTINNSCNN